MHYTSIKQSKKLLKLGLNPESADMFYSQHVDTSVSKFVEWEPNIGNAGTEESNPKIEKGHIIPCWSVEALIKIMPQHIDIGGAWMKFGIDKGWDGGIFQVYYEAKYSYIEQKGKSIIDACYDMTVWLLENGYIKKGV